LQRKRAKANERRVTMNLIKLAVGVEDVEHLSELQKRRLELKRRAGEPAELLHVTRSFPKQADAVLDGGSMYWVIKGVIRVRQRIVDLREAVTENGKPACAIVLDPYHVQTERRTYRAFQGWRYLKPEDAPKDLPEGTDVAETLPDSMADELRELGLI
jgi:hypothetical protein